jgi:hypothetical protein
MYGPRTMLYGPPDQNVLFTFCLHGQPVRRSSYARILSSGANRNYAISLLPKARSIASPSSLAVLFCSRDFCISTSASG